MALFGQAANAVATVIVAAIGAADVTVVTLLPQSHRHHTRRFHLHHPEESLAAFSTLHWLLPSAQSLAVVSYTILLSPNHSSLPNRGQGRNFNLHLAQITVHTHHRAHFPGRCRPNSYLVLPIHL